jgi:uncharacterized repeat protein (TIGR01451 family)/fimbrial isopeptide formation D2 family protein
MLHRFSSARRALTVLASLLTALVCLPGSAFAAGSPNITFGIDQPSAVLQGNQTTITLTAGDPGTEPFAYNLSYRVVLPAGISYVGGSASSTLSAPTVLANSPSAGLTTLLFPNVADLSPNSTNVGTFTVAHVVATYPIGSNFQLTGGAYVNSDPRYLPKFAADGTPTGPSATSFTGFATASGGTGSGPTATTGTLINAIQIRKSEPSPEAELLRGVHDHQTTYTLTYTNNGVQPTSGLTVDDYLPANLEFLGCGGAGSDHTTDAPTNPGSTEEYPGSGAIVVPTVTGCVTPTTVETLSIDPDGTGPLAAGVYTHVQWTGLPTVAAGAIGTIKYRAAIPMRANVLFPGGTATTGAQTANLDNNSGPEASDEQNLTNLAKIAGKYNGTLDVSDSDSITRTAEDLAIQKSVDTATLAQGQISKWTLDLEASEYRYDTNITVTDTVPDGLCPLGPANMTHAPQQVSDTECASAGPAANPSSPYTTVVEQPDGTWILTWNSSTDAALAKLAKNGTTQITFSTRTRTSYQDGYDDLASILSGDSITNTVSTNGTSNVICAGGPSDCSGAGAPIDHDGALAKPVTDVSSASQKSANPVLEKRIAQTSSNCSSDTYVKTVPSYRPGDRICWQVRVAFPSNLDTKDLTLTDFLPTNVTYDGTLGTGDLRTGNDTIPGTTLDNTTDITPGTPGGQLHWTLPSSGVVSQNKVFEHQIATTVALPTGSQVGDIKSNLFKTATQNTAGITFPLRDDQNFQLSEPVIGLTKRITALNGTPFAAVQTRTVNGGETYTFRVRVANTGDTAATATEVWDTLPTGQTCADVAAISDAGVCSAGTIKWGASPAIGPTVPAAGTYDLTYNLTVSSVKPTQAFTNTAGVRQFQTPTNQGTNFTYIPATNIDPTQNASANVPSAKDTATLTGTALSIAKVRSSPVDGTNNTSATATIGEIVHYQLNLTVPKGETVNNVKLTDFSMPDTRQPLVAGTAVGTLGAGALPGGFTVAETGGVPSITFPATYTAGTAANEIFHLDFDVKVADLATNVRGGAALSNIGRVTYDNPAGAATNLNSAAVTTAIVEPVMNVTKTDDTAGAAVHGGSVVTYTVKLTNGVAGTAASQPTISPAHETTLVDHVPSGITPLNTANNPIADGESTTSGGVWNQAARTLTFSTIATLEAGSVTTLTYKATVNDPAVGGSALTNTVNTTTTSLLGTVTGERTTNTGSSTGYANSATDTLHVDTASISKSASPTTITIGDNVVFTVNVTLPAAVALYDTTITDTLPDTIDFDGYTSATCTTGCPPETAPTVQTYTPVVNGNGTTTAAWDFGDLASTTNARIITLKYRGHLRATHRNGGAAIVKGDTTTNSAIVSSNRTDRVGAFNAATIPAPAGGFNDVSTPATATLTVIEPSFTLDKKVAVNGGSAVDGPVTVHDGDALHYSIAIKNTGNAPLYDVRVNDAPDAELTGVTLTTNAASNTDPWTPADHPMSWLIAGPIAPGATVTLGYDASLIAITSLHDGQLIDNTATAPTAFGIPQAQRTADGFTYRSYTAPSDATQAVLHTPTISLVKTTGAAGNPDSAPVQVGGTFTWRVVVTNTSSNAGATNLVVKDTLPKDWTYIGGATFAPGGAVAPTVTPHATGDDLTWNTSINLAPGASTTLTYTAKPTLASASSIGTGAGNPHVNTASASVSDTAGNSANADGPFASNADTASAILSIPVLTIAKTPDAGAANAGDTVNFHVLVKNTGTVVASNVIVTDTLPSTTTYTAGAATANPAAGFSETSASSTTIAWKITSIAAGGQVDITVPLKIGAATPVGTNIVNGASAIADETPAPVSDNGNVVIAGSADLIASKSASPNPATAGQNITYTLGVHNNGPSDAHGVTLHDVLPSTVTFVSASAGCTNAAGTVDCTVGDLAAGDDATATITATVDAGTTTNADNSVTVSSTTPDPNHANDTAGVTVPVGTSYDLSIVKTAAQPTVLHGDTDTFTFVIHNAGPSTAAGVTVTDPLPAGLSYVSDDRGCASAAGTVTCTVGPMPPGANETVHVVVSGDALGAQSNTATVSATGSPAADTDHANDSSTASITVDPSADLELLKTGPATVTAGGAATWSLKVTNHGPDAAHAVVVDDVLPAGAVFQSADAGCTAGTTAPITVHCAVGTIASGADATVHVTAQLPISLATVAVTNNATTSATEGDLVPSNNVSAAVTQVGPAADLEVKKTAPEKIDAGGTLTWTMVVTNHGPSPATKVKLSDPLPAGVKYASVNTSQGNCQPNDAGDALACDLGTIASGSSVQVALTVTVPENLGGTTVTNAAAVAGTEPDAVPANNTSTALTEITTLPAKTAALEITKVADYAPVMGRTLTYTITVKNHGPADSTDTQVVDALSGPLTYKSATADQGSCTQASNVVTCDVGTVKNGASTQVHVAVVVTGAGALPNTAMVSSPLSDRVQVDNASKAVVQVSQPKTKLTVSKKLVQRRLLAGHKASYRMRVDNVGNERATNVTVCDVLPRALTLRSASGGTIRGSSLCFTLDKLPAGHHRYFLVKVVASATADDTKVRNRATAYADNAAKVGYSKYDPLVHVKSTRTSGVTG